MKKDIVPLPLMPWNIYWINLDRRTDRRIYMEKILVNNKNNSFRIKAIDYKNNYEPYKIIKNNKLNKGEHGCMMSHIKALNYFLETCEDKYCFISEDDLSNEYLKYWQKKHFNILKYSEYEILQLQTTNNIYKNNYELMEPEKIFGSGTTFYRISRNIASKILINHFDKNKKIINLSNHKYPVADVLIYQYAETYLIPMFSYLNVEDSDTNKENNSNMSEYWENFFKDVKLQYLLHWKKLNN